MMRRNGGMVKVVAGIVAFFGLVYFIYLYNDLSGQLKNTERSAERYRREQESVSAQLQDQIIAQDQLKQRCDTDKEQMTNRLNSIQQQYKMLKSQHEDMESEFGRLQNEKEKETEEHRKQDEERAIEYSQLKQEKSLEISSLKDTVANLEREKESLSQQVNALKTQLQGTLSQANVDKQNIASLQNQVKTQQNQLQADKDTIQRNQGLLNYAQELVQQAQGRQQQIEQQYQQLQQQHQQQQQQLPIGGQQANVQGAAQQLGVNLQGGNQQGSNIFGDSRFNPQPQQQQPQQQQGGGGFFGQGLPNQGTFQGLPNNDNILGNLVHRGIGGLNQELLPQQPVGNVAQKQPGNDEGFNLADDIMKSLQDKPKPVDPQVLEEEQKQHQVVPPGSHNKDAANVVNNKIDSAGLGHQKHGQDMLGQDGRGLQPEQEQHQIGRPNLDNPVGDVGRDAHTRYRVDPADVVGAVGHDNRIQNQGPVNLQVQEPNFHGEPDKDQALKEDSLQFRPHIPVPDNQMQPQVLVDDSQREEQMDFPLGKDKIQGDNRDPNRLENIMADEDDDDKPHLPVLNAGRL